MILGLELGMALIADSTMDTLETRISKGILFLARISSTAPVLVFGTVLYSGIIDNDIDVHIASFLL